MKEIPIIIIIIIDVERVQTCFSALLQNRRKVNTRENKRGSWLTDMEIRDIRNNIQSEITNEQNQQVDEPNPIRNPGELQNEPAENGQAVQEEPCLLYTSPSPRDS